MWLCGESFERWRLQHEPRILYESTKGITAVAIVAVLEGAPPTHYRRKSAVPMILPIAGS
jgi:hypothetical protein